ncbi:MAG: hypothetical protein LBB13_02665 [Rickettsiales bacterium]|nr:hypothetical protein [Rickettsiales bacterium]
MKNIQMKKRIAFIKKKCWQNENSTIGLADRILPVLAKMKQQHRSLGTSQLFVE